MRRGHPEHACFLIVDRDLNLRNAHLALNLQIHQTLDACHAVLQLLGKAAQRVEVLAENLDGDLRAHAR